MFFRARSSSYCKTISSLVTETITGPIPEHDVDIHGWELSDINLADPDFHLSRPVDMLLGVSVMFDILRNGNIKIGEQLPLIQNTVLGWIVGGNVARLNYGGNLNRFMNENTVNLSVREWTDEEITCEQLFVDSTRRNNEGRFVLKLPTKLCVKQLGESKSTALDRMLKLEKRFEKDSKLRGDYCLFMEEYLASGHMEKVEEGTLRTDDPVFYFPHHPVLKPDSCTTKLRTVFNGSASTSTGISLNDVLMSGPTIQPELFNILLRFRCHRYAMTADIKQMFRQILIHDEDRQLQLILWRFSPEESIATYRLNTVTYGTCSAPFAATRCLRQLAIEYENRYPHTCQVIIMDFYMDDVLTGDDEPEKLIETKEELGEILQSAGFELHKWKSNEPSIVGEAVDSSSTKILGMQWDTRSDLFGFSVDVNVNAKITKRSILSEVQKIFDPLGVISPIILHGKLIMQVRNKPTCPNGLYYHSNFIKLFY